MSNNARHHLSLILPIEIWQLILSYCNFWDYVRFRQSCKRALKLPILKLPKCYSGMCSSKHAERFAENVKKELANLLTFEYNNFNAVEENYLGQFTNLTSLKIDSIKDPWFSKIDFIDLRLLTKLLELEIGSYAAVKNFTQLPRVTKLNISTCAYFHDIKELQFLPTQLLSLDVCSYRGITNLNYLQLLTYLAVPANMEINGINKLSNLLKLDLTVNALVKDLNYFPKLTSLITHAFVYNDSIKNLTNLLELESNHLIKSDSDTLVQLTKLILYDCTNPLHSDVIKELTNLLELKLESKATIKIDHLTKLKGLTVLTGRNDIEEDDLYSLSNLEALCITHKSWWHPVTHLKKLTLLQHLALYGDNDWENLISLMELSTCNFCLPLHKLTNLTKLDMRSLDELDSFDGLSVSNSVVKLYLHGYNFRLLNYLPNLTYLYFYCYVQNQSFPNYISKLTKLKRIRGIKEDYVSLLNLTNLEKITISPVLKKETDEIFFGKSHIRYRIKKLLC